MSDFPEVPPALWIENGLLDPATVNLSREILRRSAHAIEAEDTTLWLVGDDALIPILGSGSHAPDFIGHFQQPLTEGLISLVYASGQALTENAVENNPAHSDRLDKRLGISTTAMIALPVSVLGRNVGVITCVHTTSGNNFTTNDMAEFEFAAACLSRFLDTAVLLADGHSFGS